MRGIPGLQWWWWSQVKGVERRGLGQSLQLNRGRRWWSLLRSWGGSCKGKMKKMKWRGFVKELGLADRFLKFGCIIIRILLLLLLLLLAMHLLLPPSKRGGERRRFFFLGHFLFLSLFMFGCKLSLLQSPLDKRPYLIPSPFFLSFFFSS